MPTLADIYSAADSFKRRLADAASNPSGALSQMLGYANDRARAWNEQSAQNAQQSMQTGEFITPQDRQIAAQLAEAYNPVGMTVWHGSPHLFEKFDLSKIGTGEGAQAYGKGLYFAENPKVAEFYKYVHGGGVPTPDVIEYMGHEISNLSGTGKVALRPVGATNPGISVGTRGLPTGGTDASILNFGVGATPAKLKNAFPDFSNDQISALQSLITYRDPEIAAQKLISKGKKDAAQIALDTGDQFKIKKMSDPNAALYKVDLPDTHIRRMLDWDEPLKNQPKQVRDLAKSLGMDMNDLGGDLIGKIGKGEEGKQILQKAGIRGIKYLDQMSRDAKTGTRNFVVFDPNHLTILERNNKPIQPTKPVEDLSYRGSHTAPGPEFGAPLHDLTGGGQMYPSDVYSASASRIYGTGYPQADREAFDLAKRVRGNPDAPVTMYRAVPKDESIKSINPGDWVSLSKSYAQNHGESVLGKDYKIISQKVKAKDLWTNADSIHEFGYHPSND